MVARLAGSRLGRVQYLDTSVAEGDSEDWDFGDWHLAEPTVRLETQRCTDRFTDVR